MSPLSPRHTLSEIADMLAADIPRLTSVLANAVTVRDSTLAAYVDYVRSAPWYLARSAAEDVDRYTVLRRAELLRIRDDSPACETYVQAYVSLRSAQHALASAERKLAALHTLLDV